ncbi:MAG: hypothetical protein EPN30_11270 [Actinomycetota bacterium]|nr:MAG: hypothetical protein EPN30_11270 [Actinomycetota bacterium]
MSLLSLRKAALAVGVAGLTVSLTGVGAAAAEGSPGGQGTGVAVTQGEPGSLQQVVTVKFPSPYLNPKSFDISWVDSQTQTYYLADRTNNSVDAINAATDTFEGTIGSGDFSGTGATATSAQKSTCGPFGVAGPNGDLVLRVGGVTQLWAGDGVTSTSPTSTVKVFDLSSPSSGTLAASISTGGQCRADELAYDPVDNLVVIANDVDTPPYLTFISVNANPANDKVVGKIPFANAIDGIEQPAWNPANDMFYVNIPQIPTTDGSWMGEVAVINPRTMNVATTLPVPGCSPGGLAINVQLQQMLLGCSGDAIAGDTVNGVTYPGNAAVSYIMDVKTGRIVAKFAQVGGSDEVWYNPSTGQYYLAASNMTSNGLSSGYHAPVLGVISSHGNRWLENFPTAVSAHSVAANSMNGQVFVPIPGYGIAVFAPTHGDDHAGSS